MAAKSKSDSTHSDTLSVPAAITEVAKGVVTAKGVQPTLSKNEQKAQKEAQKEKEKAEQPPQRSRAELQSDIRDARAELNDVMHELERRLDVGARTRTVIDDVRADPIEGARKHKKAVVIAGLAVAAVSTGLALAVRAIVK